MRIGTSYKQHRGLSDRWDAIVVGSGIGGLTTAAFLARSENKHVLVLERHYTAGGFTHTFRQPGFEWDVGVHYIGGVNREKSHLRKLFNYISDGQLEWADMGEVYDRIYIGDREYDFVKGRKEFHDRLCDYFPSEERSIDRYLELVKESSRAGRNFYTEKALP